MDNKQEILNKLEQAKKDRDLVLAEANKEVDRLAKELAEAEKPVKLRHGDYGFVGTDGILVTDGRNDERQDYNNFGIVGEYLEAKGVLGNIFDDLKAISKPLEEFEVYGRTIKFDGDGDLRIPRMWIAPKNIHDFILNLRCLEAKNK